MKKLEDMTDEELLEYGDAMLAEFDRIQALLAHVRREAFSRVKREHGLVPAAKMVREREAEIKAFELALGFAYQGVLDGELDASDIGIDDKGGEDDDYIH